MKSPQSLPKPKKPKLPLSLRRVSGVSMTPTLQPGQIILVAHWLRPKAGRIVMIRHNGIDKIKRIQDIKPGQVYVVGDNPLQSTDSRQLGWLPISLVRGRVVGRRLSPPR